MAKLSHNYSKLTLAKFIKALFSKATHNYIKLIIGLALTYTVLPLDFIPDLLGPLGFSDDAAVLTLLTTLAIHLLEIHQNQQVLEARQVTKPIDDGQVID